MHTRPPQWGAEDTDKSETSPCLFDGAPKKSHQTLCQQVPLITAVFATVIILFLFWGLGPSKPAVIQPPSFASLEEITLQRDALIKQNRRRPLQNKIDSSTSPPPGVALVFLTIRGVRHHTLWQRWFEDAFAWLESEGLESNHDVIDETKHRSNIIRAYVHHPYWLDPSLKAGSVPPVMRAGIIEESADCTWRIINHCFHRGLEAAVDDFEFAEWFYTVASDAVPVKSFGEMYSELLDDGRSRLEFVRLLFDENVPKVYNWVLFTREVASVLAKHPEEWVHGSFRTTELRHWQAGADEWAVYIPLLKRFGEDFFSMLSPGVVDIPWEARPLEVSVNTFACWGSCDPFGANKGSPPVAFTAMNRTGFERVHSSGTVTHARKFEADSIVIGCPLRRQYVPRHSITLFLDPLSSVERKSFGPAKRPTAGRDRTGLVSEAAAWSQAKFGPFYSKGNCTITDFLAWRLNINSITEEKGDSAPPTIMPGDYQFYNTFEQQHKALVAHDVYGVRPEIIARYAKNMTDESPSL